MDPLQKSLDSGGLEFRELTNKSNGSSAGHGNVFLFVFLNIKKVLNYSVKTTLGHNLYATNTMG